MAPSPAVASAQNAVEWCTDHVRIEWSGVQFDPKDADPGTSGFLVRSVKTVSGESGCAGDLQVLVLLTDDGEVLYEGTAVVDERGIGRYRHVDLPVEHVTGVRVLLAGDVAEVRGRDVDRGAPEVLGGGEPRGERPAGELPMTGVTVSFAAAFALLLLAAALGLKRTLWGP